MAWGVWRRWGFAVLAGSAAWRLALGCQLVGGIDEFKPFIGGEASANANQVGKPCASNDECPAKICIQVVPPGLGEDGGADADAEAGATDAGGDADADAATPKVSVPSPTGNACSAQCATVADCVVGWTCERDVALDHNICKCTFVSEICDDKDNDCNGEIDDTYDKSTDPNNCGKCGNVCGEGTTCVSGHCACAGEPQCDGDKDKQISASCISGICRKLQKIADDPHAPGPLASDGTTVAWARTETEEDDSQDPPVTTTHPSVVAAPAAGGGVVTTLRKAADCTDGNCAIHSIDQENGTAYWGELNPGAIRSCALAGCGGNPRQVTSETGGTVVSIRASGGTLYWLLATGSGSRVRLVPEAGGNATDRNGAGGNGGTLAVDGTTVFTLTTDGTVREFRSGDPGSRNIAVNQGTGPVVVDGSGVYWVANNAAPAPLRACARGQACTGPSSNPSPRVVASSAAAPLTVADGKLYFVDSQTIRTCPTSGCPATPMVVVKNASPRGFAIAGDFLYFTTDKGVFRVSR